MKTRPLCLFVHSRFNQLELLQGDRDQKEWELLKDYLSTQYYLEASQETWPEATRIYFEVRRKGAMINSPIDCCVAQIALEHSALLLHRDKDFEKFLVSGLWNRSVSNCGNFAISELLQGQKTIGKFLAYQLFQINRLL